MTYQVMHCVRCLGTPAGLLYCHRCDTAKPLSAFYRGKSGRIESGCKECRRAHSRNYGRTVLGHVPRPPRKEASVAYKPKVTIKRGKAPQRARCEGCDWTQQCTRERARQHAAEKGHVVHFVIPDITTYYPMERTA